MIVFKCISSNKVETRAVPAKNVLEVSSYEGTDNKSWVKYWDGEKVRSMVVEGSVLNIVHCMEED